MIHDITRIIKKLRVKFIFEQDKINPHILVYDDNNKILTCAILYQ